MTKGLISFLSILLVCFSALITAHSQIINVTIPSTPFVTPYLDGSYLSGTFTVNTANQTVISADITTTEGVFFGGANYTASNSSAVLGDNGNAMFSFVNSGNRVTLYYGNTDDSYAPFSANTPLLAGNEEASNGGWRSTSLPVEANRVFISEVSTPFYSPSLKLHTFVSTDTITVKAGVVLFPAGVPVVWKVIGRGAANGLGGFPLQEMRVTDNNGISTFTFSPKDNPLFPANRLTWAKLGVTPNLPLRFDVTATVIDEGRTFTAKLSEIESYIGKLMQDETDVVRQEYIDFALPTIPTRADFVTSLGQGFNEGNYSIQMDSGLQSKYNAVLAAYRGRQISVKGQTVTIPNSAQLLISGYHNPRRSAGINHSSATAGSHLFGKALDLTPSPITVSINGKQVILGTAQLMKPLLEAASSAGTAFLEQGRFGSSSLSKADRIHVQWN